ncbi:tol-pal system-associated acyl-CoA thioesterase [soil metagenome]
MEFPFSHRQRVRYGETDTQGVVYYANYLLFAEVGRMEYFRSLGITYHKDFIERGLDFTIIEAHVRYNAPLRFDDEFDIRLRVGDVMKSSWSFGYAIDRAEGLRCASITTVQVTVDRDRFKATRIPDELRKLLHAEHARGDAGVRAPAGAG